MSVVGLLRENTHPSEAEVRYVLGENVCRCTGCSKVVKAILSAAEMGRKRGK